jgi:hypothetical protein
MTDPVNDYYRSLETMERDIASTLGVTIECARDILYLRTRHRHTQELEDELIRLHSAGTPPNMMDFGVTPETQQALMDTVKSIVDERSS